MHLARVVSFPSSCVGLKGSTIGLLEGHRVADCPRCRERLFPWSLAGCLGGMVVIRPGERREGYALLVTEYLPSGVSGDLAYTVAIERSEA